MQCLHEDEFEFIIGFFGGVIIVKCRGHVPDSYLEWVIENINQKSVCDIAGQVLDERRKLKIYVKDDEDYVRNEFYDAIMDGMDAREF